MTILPDSFQQAIAPRPRTIEETGLSGDFLATLTLKHLQVNGVADLSQLSEHMALSGCILETVLIGLRKHNLVEALFASQASQGERYALTDKGVAEALLALNKSGYAGHAPVPLKQYSQVVQAQSIQNSNITRTEVHKVFRDTIIDPQLLDQLGPALHSGRAIMIYGLAGTGKTYICKRLANLLGAPVLLPYAISAGESIIRLYDPALHRPINAGTDQLSVHLDQGTDPRFIRCQRPVAISGGELTLNMLEIDHDKNVHVSEAPLQLKANNGMYIIDDLGRQRVSPVELFNRWIVPLEEKHDYLSMETGRRVQLPFDVILIFSTNLNPAELADDAFLRRLGYKIKFAPINQDRYLAIWRDYAQELQLACPDNLLDAIFERYHQEERPLLPCQPRDLLGIVKDQCEYEGVARTATAEKLHLAWNTYFVNPDIARIDS